MKILNVRTAVAALALSTVGIFSFRAIEAGKIKGTITPGDAAVRAWAISSTDTLKASVSNGTFEIPDAKAGTYRVIIEATPAYKNTAKDNVTVTDGSTTDIGSVELVKKEATDSTGKH